ncbi:hypothetical protein QKU48_gp0383 [Fadolivirus algeromassiliense]|jgi:hypothetical protein|uniref:Uncharacterized protein n=1 Tax=Fadolivirus FV1/VV64 TaxID=3070911 RepID=A0A7D3R0N9_9VIRU|nr:hypothetical protein QKU48_gp0383 [Fadolivirus algeromassiliense]QKF93841.1 hypothetical protein Fadolivirus_1_383 [Fadolivirus FV1/VV64]
MNKLIIVILFLLIFGFIASRYNNEISNSINIEGKNICYLSMLIALVLGIFTLIKWNEGFEVIMSSPDKEVIKKIDLEHFFQYVEYFQTNDLKPDENVGLSTCKREGEYIKIANNIRNLLSTLHFMVNVNDRDNFYQRYLVMKVGANLEYDKAHPFRRNNYDELVRNKIGKEFTFLPQNEYDRYYPRPSIDSEYQYPLPNTINVHNYYNGENVEVNLMGLKMLLEIVHDNNMNDFEDLYRPTEYIVFEKEFFNPLKSIKNSIVEVVNTNSYRDYISNQKFSDKYKDITYAQGLLNLF